MPFLMQMYVSIMYIIAVLLIATYTQQTISVFGTQCLFLEKEQVVNTMQYILHVRKDTETDCAYKGLIK